MRTKNFEISFAKNRNKNYKSCIKPNRVVCLSICGVVHFHPGHIYQGLHKVFKIRGAITLR